MGDNLGMTDVRLVDLEMFKRYSLAIRQEAAPAEELLAVLDVTRQQVEEFARSARRTTRRDRDVIRGGTDDKSFEDAAP